jgi:predicted 2-oxoglutarate/Fe(II)-dependent dioxygenase YbiX
MIEAHPVTDRIYQFPEFDFLVSPGRSWFTRLVDFNSGLIVGTVDTTEFKDISLSPQIGINPTYIQNLFQAAKRSMVGVGSETIHDEEIRASSEIHADFITLYPQFMDYINQMVNNMAFHLGHPTTVKPQLYKLVLYKEGDHFEDHIDNDHVKDMIMTLSVEFPVALLGEQQGGDLMFGDESVDHPNNNQLGLALFYHDTHHKVTKITNGYRMSLIFDVLQNPDQLIPQVIQQYLPSFQLEIQKLREKGVRRIGSLTNHLYLLSDGENMTYKSLKGMDRIFWELLRNGYIEEVANSDNSFYFEALIPIMTLEGGFGTVYRDHTEDEDENRETEKQPTAITDYNLIELRFDPDRIFRAVHPKYRMGDVVLLKSKGELSLRYSGDNELYLGNEGFSGSSIYSNLGLFADI